MRKNFQSVGLQKCGRDRLVGVTVLGVGVTGLTGRGSICKGRLVGVAKSLLEVAKS